MDPGLFENCLKYWIEQDTIGKTYSEDIKIDQEDGRILGYKSKIEIMPIPKMARDGVVFMDDMMKLTTTYGLKETYSWYRRYLDIESYKIMMQE